jgi:hypothetical protein
MQKNLSLVQSIAWVLMMSLSICLSLAAIRQVETNQLHRNYEANQ